MSIMNKFKYEKGVAASTVNDIVSSVLQLQHHNPPNITNFDDYQKIVNSNYLQDTFLERTNKSYTAPIQMDSITDVDGRVHAIKFTMMPLKSLLCQAFANTSLVDHLSQQQQQSSQRHPSPDIKCPLDSAIASRTRKLIKLEVYVDDTQYSPGFFNSSQKYTCVYLCLADIPFHHRTKADSIDIYLLINAKQLKQLNLKNRDGALFGILRQEIDTINQKGGIKLRDSTGKCFRMEITISTVLGDNLAIYPLLGFSASFRNTSFYCRFCGARGSSKDGGDDTQELFKYRKMVDGATVTNLELQGVRPERGDFAFNGLHGINRWNIAPPDLVSRPPLSSFNLE